MRTKTKKIERYVKSDAFRYLDEFLSDYIYEAHRDGDSYHLTEAYLKVKQIMLNMVADRLPGATKCILVTPNEPEKPKPARNDLNLNEMLELEQV